MSDREGHSGAPPGDDDLSLPKATVTKMIAGEAIHPQDATGSDLDDDNALELLPEDVTCAKETRDLVIECCVGERCYFTTRSETNLIGAFLRPS